MTLSQFVMLPTPTAVQRDHPERVEKLKATGAKTMMSRAAGELRGNSIMDAVIFYEIMPTPQARDWKGKSGGHQKGKDLPTIIAMGMLPTPTAMEGGKITGKENQDSLTKRARLTTGQTSQLNPRFVLEMMGFPPNWTELPFQNGETKA